MGIREQLNENPRLTTAITIALIVIVLGYIYWSSGRAGGGGGSGTVGQVWFTDDDGKTWFPDDPAKIPPFDRNGKQAVRAHVYKCDGKTFVNHVERYSPEAKKKLESAQAQQALEDAMALDVVRVGGLEVKSPGQKEWVKASDPRAVEVMKPKCKGDDLEVVLP